LGFGGGGVDRGEVWAVWVLGKGVVADNTYASLREREWVTGVVRVVFVADGSRVYADDGVSGEGVGDVDEAGVVDLGLKPFMYSWVVGGQDGRWRVVVVSHVDTWSAGKHREAVESLTDEESHCRVRVIQVW
jgi:hypothetical protein